MGTVILDFEVGQKVKMIGAPDIDAVVTAYTVRQSTQVTYELTWIHDGEVKTGWLTSDSIGTERKGQIGFLGNSGPSKVTKP